LTTAVDFHTFVAVPDVDPFLKNPQKELHAMALAKDRLAKSVHKNAGLPRYLSNGVVHSLFEIIKKTLENGEDVLISGFGKFYVKNKDERRGRNPKTGESLMLAPRRVVKFKCSQKLRDKVNGKSG
jgi:integration host factor subunit alpha